MRSLTSFLSVIMLFLFASTLHAFIINVPGDYATIQDAINASVDDDTVLVADGTYTGDGNRDIRFFGKAIVVMSENGPEFCIIDCESDSLDWHRGFYFRDGEGSTSVLKGFTITNGYNNGGGGIRCDYSSPTITGNVITGNSSNNNGGGIDVNFFSSSPIIDGNTIVGNMAPGRGAGIFCRESFPIIKGNTIEGNTGGYGAGIACTKSSPNIKENVITGNTSDRGGGGIYCRDYSSPLIKNNTITDNLSNDAGGGIYCEFYATPTILNNIITGNIANGLFGGGGIFCKASLPFIRNNIISSNSAINGGGITLKHSSPVITNNTITLNTADHGGGIYLKSNSLPTINNCILWGNSTDEIYIEWGSPVVTYSNIQGGWPGEGNIDDDPLFFTYTDPPLVFEYFLDNGSLCIDTGDSSIEDLISDWHPLWPPWHNDGPRSDMGAYGGPWGILGWIVR